MSLTSILKDKDRKDIKDWFKKNFPNHGLDAGIIVPSKGTHAGYWGEVGTAFDYLMRFNLERINNDRLRGGTSWVAALGKHTILNSLSQSTKPKIRIGYKLEREVDRTEFMDFVENKFQDAVEHHDQFMRNGKVTDDLVRASVFLAKLDVTVRAGFIDANMDNIEQDKIEELKELLSVVPWDKFKAKKYCMLNPTFGDGSVLVGGADADLIVDDTLIDIKTVQKLSVTRDHLNQLIGYYLLSIVDRNGLGGEFRLKNVAIYFARYGYLWSFPLSNYYTEQEYENLADQFAHIVNPRFADYLKSDKFKALVQHSKDITSQSGSYRITKQSTPKCPYCGSNELTRHGKTVSGKSRYKCKKCNRTFSTDVKPG